MKDQETPVFLLLHAVGKKMEGKCHFETTPRAAATRTCDCTVSYVHIIIMLSSTHWLLPVVIVIMTYEADTEKRRLDA